MKIAKKENFQIERFFDIKTPWCDCYLSSIQLKEARVKWFLILLCCFFKVYANYATNSTDNRAKNDVVDERSVKNEAVIECWKSKKSDDGVNETDKQTACKPHLLLFFQTEQNSQKDTDTFDDLVDRSYQTFWKRCEFEAKRKNQNADETYAKRIDTAL